MVILKTDNNFYSPYILLIILILYEKINVNFQIYLKTMTIELGKHLINKQRYTFSLSNRDRRI